MWINLANVTLAKMQESGGLWVCDRCPEDGVMRPTIWLAVAEEEDTLMKIVAKMAMPALGKLPRGLYERQVAFGDILNHNPRNILVITDAHLLSKKVLSRVWGMAEEMAPVVLCGDVLTIGAALLTDASSIQRAQFCVDAVDVF
jgi:hypothetical protein